MSETPETVIVSPNTAPQPPDDQLPPDQIVDQSEKLTDAEGQISWTGPEFIGHAKTAGWYATLAAGTLLAAAGIYFLTKDIISTIVVVVGAILFGVYAARQPNQVEYHLASQGFSIGNKFHHYDEFRSFSLVTEGGHTSIVFSPLKRFSPMTTLYYDPKDQDKITDMLANRLPMEEYRHDAIDRLMARIRF